MLSERTSSALAGISKATLKDGVRVKHLFRIMTHYPDVWMRAYANIYANRGATTKGVDDNTLDGMSQERVSHLIQLLKDGHYEPKPARRTYIPKANGKMRSLGIPTGDDKLVQEVVRILLEGIYEPVFSSHSHGFRPNRSCHTALRDISDHWKGVKWIVDMDIKGFFDNIDHDVLIGCLELKIDDPKFIGLIRQFLKAGYLDEWKFHETYSGTPQGGIVSPILANVVLHELDQFAGEKQRAFNQGTRRQSDREYRLLTKQVAHWRIRIDILRKRGAFDFMIDELRDRIRKLEDERRNLPVYVMDDENYRRLHYIRYADDFAIGLIGSRKEAEQVYQEIGQFLREKLKLEVADEKSGIRSIKAGFGFLGYHLYQDVNNDRVRKVKAGATKDGRTTYRKFRSLRSQIWLQAPKEKVWAFCRRKGYLKGDEPQCRPYLLNLSDYEIISTYNAEMRGLANYYAMAPKRSLRILEWAGLTSLFKTLAAKHKTTSARLFSKMKVADEHILRYQQNGQPRVLKVFKLKHRTDVPLHVDREPITIPFGSQRSELVERLNASQCEYCGKTGGFFEVHHIRKLKDIQDKKNKAAWEIRMIARRRKTMILCIECHDLLHAGKLQGWKRDIHTEMESPVRGNVHAGFGGGHTSSASDSVKGVKSRPDWW